jgi:hypothetical protein
MLVEYIDKSTDVSDIMLSISIECDDILPTMMLCMLSDIGESCLECGSPTPIYHMMHDSDRITELLL